MLNVPDRNDSLLVRYSGTLPYLPSHTQYHNSAIWHTWPQHLWNSSMVQFCVDLVPRTQDTWLTTYSSVGTFSTALLHTCEPATFTTYAQHPCSHHRGGHVGPTSFVDAMQNQKTSSRCSVTIYLDTKKWLWILLSKLILKILHIIYTQHRTSS
jgi:hypothetical protein